MCEQHPTQPMKMQSRDMTRQSAAQKHVTICTTRQEHKCQRAPTVASSGVHTFRQLVQATCDIFEQFRAYGLTILLFLHLYSLPR